MGHSGSLDEARAAVRCGVSDKARNAVDGPEWPTAGRILLPSRSVAYCLRYLYRGAVRALPEGKIIPVKWVNNCRPWYYKIRRLVFVEEHNDFNDARARERTLKRWRRAWKLELIERINPQWRDLYDEIQK